jgi:hypothetical protein
VGRCVHVDPKKIEVMKDWPSQRPSKVCMDFLASHVTTGSLYKTMVKL